MVGCRGNLSTLYAFVGAHFWPVLKLIYFNAIELFTSENTLVLTQVVRCYKHLSTNLIVVDGIIIQKSFDKPVKTGGIKVSIKRWHNGSQNQISLCVSLFWYQPISFCNPGHVYCVASRTMACCTLLDQFIEIVFRSSSTDYIHTKRLRAAKR